MLWSLLLACEAPPEEALPAAEPPLLQPAAPTPTTHPVLTAWRSGDGLSGCPRPTERRIGDVEIFCIDPARVDVASAEAGVRGSDAALRVVLLQTEHPWPFWFWGADITLFPSETPIRNNLGGQLQLGVTDSVTVERGSGWSRVAETWLRDDLPLGLEMLLVPRQHPTLRSFHLPDARIVQQLDLELLGGPAEVHLNGIQLTLGTPNLIEGSDYVHYSPDIALLQTGENRLSAPVDLSVMAQIGSPVALDWTRGHPQEGWTTVRFDDSSWEDPDGSVQRAVFWIPVGTLGGQVSLDGPGRVWVNEVLVLQGQRAAWGQIPTTLLMPGENVIALQAAEGISAALWAYSLTRSGPSDPR